MKSAMFYIQCEKTYNMHFSADFSETVAISRYRDMFFIGLMFQDEIADVSIHFNMELSDK